MSDSLIRKALAVYYKKCNDQERYRRILKIPDQSSTVESNSSKDIVHDTKKAVDKVSEIEGSTTSEDKSSPSLGVEPTSQLATSFEATRIPSIIVDPARRQTSPKHSPPSLGRHTLVQPAFQPKNVKSVVPVQPVSTFENPWGTYGAFRTHKSSPQEAIRTRTSQMMTFDSRREKAFLEPSETSLSIRKSKPKVQKPEKTPKPVVIKGEEQFIQAIQENVGVLMSKGITNAMNMMKDNKDMSSDGRIVELDHDSQRAKDNWNKAKKKITSIPELEEIIADVVGKMEKKNIEKPEKPKGVPKPEVEKKEEATQTSPRLLEEVKTVKSTETIMNEQSNISKSSGFSVKASVEINPTSASEATRSTTSKVYPGLIHIQEIFVEPRYDESKRKEKIPERKAIKNKVKAVQIVEDDVCCCHHQLYLDQKSPEKEDKKSKKDPYETQKATNKPIKNSRCCSRRAKGMRSMGTQMEKEDLEKRILKDPPIRIIHGLKSTSNNTSSQCSNPVRSHYEHEESLTKNRFASGRSGNFNNDSQWHRGLQMKSEDLEEETESLRYPELFGPMEKWGDLEALARLLPPYRSVKSDTTTSTVDWSPASYMRELSARSPMNRCNGEYEANQDVQTSSTLTLPKKESRNQGKINKMPVLTPKIELFGTPKQQKSPFRLRKYSDKSSAGRRRPKAVIRSHSPSLRSAESEKAAKKKDVDYTVMTKARVIKSFDGAVFELTADVFDQNSNLSRQVILGSLPDYLPGRVSVNGQYLRRVDEENKL